MSQPYVFNALSDVNAMDLWTASPPAIRDRLKPELFYSKQLLDTLRIDTKHYVYFRLADAMPIGEKADKLVLRRWTPLHAHTVPLAEGIPPNSDRGAVMKYEIEAKQYGRYMEFTDKVDFEAVDPIVANYSREYSIVAMETMDLLAQKALMSNCSQYFAGGVANFAAIATPISGTTDVYPDMTPKLQDLIDITLVMKKALVKPRSNGRFHVIGSPEFMADMISDPIVEKYMTINQTTKNMYDDGVLCPLFGMEFYETMVCPTSGLYVDNGVYKCLGIVTDAVTYASSARTAGTLVTSTNAVTGKAAHYEQADIGSTYMNVAGNTELLAPTDHIPNNYAAGSTVPIDISSSDRVNLFGAGIGFGNEANVSTKISEYKVQHVFVIGDKALVRTGLTGEDQSKMYVKPLGSAGVLDPINQRQSIGFKINSVGFAVIESRAVTDYICIPAALAQAADVVCPQT